MTGNRTVDLLHELGYQYPWGETTHGPCLTEDCDEGSRGGLYCRKCAVTRLAGVTTPTFAARTASLFLARAEIQSEIDKLYRSAKDGHV